MGLEATNPESVGDFVCFRGDKSVHKDLELGDIESGGKHKGCGNEAAIWECAAPEIKKAATRLGVRYSYTVKSALYGGRGLKINQWDGAY